MTAQQLKNSILQMAVQGKLVSQDPNDEPARVLLERIRAEKQELIEQGKIKREKNPSVIFKGADNYPYEKIGDNEPVCIADEVPFEIPESWEWCRLIECCVKEIKRGKSPTYTDHSSTLVFAQKCNVKTGGINMDLAQFLDESTLKKYPDDEFMCNNDIVLNSTGTGTIGRVGIFHDSDNPAEMRIVPDSHVTIVRCGNCISSEYIFYYLKFVQSDFEKLGEGSTNQKELKADTIKSVFIPLPPLNEQHRIVSKIEELLPYITEYEKTEKNLTALNKAFPDQLKKSILQQAVQGKLVPQDPNDETASVLLEHIRAEKQELIKVKKIKKDKNESVIYKRDNSHYELCNGVERCIDDEIPFEIPESWCWARCSSLGSIIRGSGIKRTETIEKGSPCIRYGEIYTSYDLAFSDTISFIPQDLFDQCKHISKNDVIFTLTGENKPDIAKAIVYLGDEPIAAGGDLAYWTCHGMNPMYLVLFLSCPYAINRKVALATGDIIVHISGEKIGSILIPVPPLNEQHRIVNQVENITSIIEEI